VKRNCPGPRHAEPSILWLARGAAAANSISPQTALGRAQCARRYLLQREHGLFYSARRIFAYELSASVKRRVFALVEAERAGKMQGSPCLNLRQRRCNSRWWR